MSILLGGSVECGDKRPNGMVDYVFTKQFLSQRIHMRKNLVQVSTENSEKKGRMFMMGLLHPLGCGIRWSMMLHASI